MNPDEAVKAHLDLAAELSVAIHHSTVQLTDEAIGDPVAALSAALEVHGVEPRRFRILDPGAGLRLPGLAARRAAVLGSAAK
jgi:L-ascorbate metabolism protein UlaG (beta-lactamase superfamily)